MEAAASHYGSSSLYLELGLKMENVVDSTESFRPLIHLKLNKLKFIS